MVRREGPETCLGQGALRRPGDTCEGPGRTGAWQHGDPWGLWSECEGGTSSASLTAEAGAEKAGSRVPGRLCPARAPEGAGWTGKHRT